MSIKSRERQRQKQTTLSTIHPILDKTAEFLVSSGVYGGVGLDRLGKLHGAFVFTDDKKSISADENCVRVVNDITQSLKDGGIHFFPDGASAMAI